jgi:hypothetical protein
MGVELILAALAAGAVAASKDVASQAVKDAYNGLKNLLKRHFADKPEAQVALEQHAAKPDTWKLPLQDALEQTGADKDQAILDAARRLQNLARAELTNVSATGDSAVAIGHAQDVATHGSAIVKPTIGNVTGSSLAIAGRDASSERVTYTGASDETLRALFAPVLDEVRARPASRTVSNEDLQRRVEEIRDEAAKGEAADASRIGGWLRELGAIAPDLRDRAASALHDAGEAISAGVRQAVEQVRSIGG